MKPEEIADLQRRFAWLPQDYLRAMTVIEPGRRRYGIEWFAGPRRPAEFGGAGADQAYPTAWWIGRRAGNPVGYENTDAASPSLCEWGGSQRRHLARFSGIDALALSQIHPDADRRPRIEFELDIPGVAFGPWRLGGETLDAPCLISVGLETTAIANVLNRLGPGWELLLMEADRDAGLCVRRAAPDYELRTIGHGYVGTWKPASRDGTLTVCTALAPYNDGADAGAFGRLSLPAALPGEKREG